MHKFVLGEALPVVRFGEVRVDLYGALTVKDGLLVLLEVVEHVGPCKIIISHGHRTLTVGEVDGILVIDLNRLGIELYRGLEVPLLERFVAEILLSNVAAWHRLASMLAYLDRVRVVHVDGGCLLLIALLAHAPLLGDVAYKFQIFFYF